MDDSYERVYSPRGVQQVPLGLYIVRGDNVYVTICFCFVQYLQFLIISRAVVGDVDEELDKKINYAALKSEQIPPIVH